MSILTILFALLLSGSINFTAHTGSVNSSSAATASQTPNALPVMTVDDYGGGPTT